MMGIIGMEMKHKYQYLHVDAFVLRDSTSRTTTFCDIIRCASCSTMSRNKSSSTRCTSTSCMTTTSCALSYPFAF